MTTRLPECGTSPHELLSIPHSDNVVAKIINRLNKDYPQINGLNGSLSRFSEREAELLKEVTANIESKVTRLEADSPDEEAMVIDLVEIDKIHELFVIRHFIAEVNKFFTKARLRAELLTDEMNNAKSERDRLQNVPNSKRTRADDQHLSRCLVIAEEKKIKLNNVLSAWHKVDQLIREFSLSDIADSGRLTFVLDDISKIDPAVNSKISYQLPRVRISRPRAKNVALSDANSNENVVNPPTVSHRPVSKLRKFLAAALYAASTHSPSVPAVEGATQLDVTFPEVLQFYNDYLYQFIVPQTLDLLAEASGLCEVNTQAEIEGEIMPIFSDQEVSINGVTLGNAFNGQKFQYTVYCTDHSVKFIYIGNFDTPDNIFSLTTVLDDEADVSIQPSEAEQLLFRNFEATTGMSYSEYVTWLIAASYGGMGFNQILSEDEKTIKLDDVLSLAGVAKIDGINYPRLNLLFTYLYDPIKHAFCNAMGSTISVN